MRHTAKNALISTSKLPKAFAASLLDYVGSQAQYLHTLMAITQTGKVESNQHGDRLRRVEMALEALRNVIKHNPGRLKTELPQYTLLWTTLKTVDLCSLFLPVRRKLVLLANRL